MAEPLPDLIASVRARLQNELDAQLRAVSDNHVEAVAEARRQAELEAEQRWSGLLEDARSETRQRVESGMAATTLETAGAVEVQPFTARHDDQPLKSVALALGRVEAATSLVATLDAIADSAASWGPSTLFVVTGSELHPWTHAAAGPTDAVDAVTRDAVASKMTVRGDTTIAAPLVIDETVAAVLYAPRTEGTGPMSCEAIEVLARYGAAHLANLTLLRTAEARQWLADRSTLYGTGTRTDTPADASEDETAAARRFARLLVSEIKLYNEGAVRIGRERRDLLQRLGEEIDRARRLYEERVPATVAGRAQHFHHELVQTLAGGDPALLG